MKQDIKNITLVFVTVLSLNQIRAEDTDKSTKELVSQFNSFYKAFHGYSEPKYFEVFDKARSNPAVVDKIAGEFIKQIGSGDYMQMRSAIYWLERLWPQIKGTKHEEEIAKLEPYLAMLFIKVPYDEPGVARGPNAVFRLFESVMAKRDLSPQVKDALLRIAKHELKDGPKVLYQSSEKKEPGKVQTMSHKANYPSVNDELSRSASIDVADKSVAVIKFFGLPHHKNIETETAANLGFKRLTSLPRGTWSYHKELGSALADFDGSQTEDTLIKTIKSSYGDALLSSKSGPISSLMGERFLCVTFFKHLTEARRSDRILNPKIRNVLEEHVSSGVSLDRDCAISALLQITFVLQKLRKNPSSDPAKLAEAEAAATEIRTVLRSAFREDSKEMLLQEDTPSRMDYRQFLTDGIRELSNLLDDPLRDRTGSADVSNSLSH